jgi:hypothetical protein
MELTISRSNCPVSLGRNLNKCIWRFGLALLLAATVTSLSTQATPSPHTSGSRSTVKVKARPQASLTDYLLVRVTDSYDQDNFDQLLKETNCTFVKTITAGSENVLVVQTQPGQGAAVAKKFAKSKEVSCCEQNRICYQSGSLDRFKYFGLINGVVDPVPSDPDFSQQWDLPAMNWVTARTSLLPTPAPTYLYILDSGTTPIPNELGNTTVQLDFSGVPHPTGALVPVHDPFGHGTLVTSVTAVTNNHFGLAGPANFNGAQTYVYIFQTTASRQFGTTMNYLEAMAGILASNLPVGPVNMSFQYSPPNMVNADPMIQSFARQLKNKGYLVVLAAGNYGLYDSSPELYCRRVAAIDNSGKIASWSNTGPFAAAAPGNAVPVYSSDSTSGTVFTASGTSMAAPRWCSAILAVMRYLPANLRTVAYADQIVFKSATVNSEGYRIPNFAAAIKMAIGVP